MIQRPGLFCPFSAQVELQKERNLIVKVFDLTAKKYFKPSSGPSAEEVFQFLVDRVCNYSLELSRCLTVDEAVSVHLLYEDVELPVDQMYQVVQRVIANFRLSHPAFALATRGEIIAELTKAPPRSNQEGKIIGQENICYYTFGKEK